jgi:hypothetical protein
MTDIHMIPGTEIPLKHNKLKWFEVTETKLLSFRKWFLILTGLLTVTMVVDLYIDGGASIRVGMDGLLALLMLVFSTKCETRLLKMRIEKSLEKLEVE